ncbi:MAG: phosphoenolpyruvate carboxykinase (GTP) [Sulfolobales archaeon]|nr:phosphoenolpyruvate carboxykinase (GTP) [Sulfolobales archaeon]MDW8082477.1 phosphoenolpyruvate carboxykinase (GTP) [Sulfolobales archaeon]
MVSSSNLNSDAEFLTYLQQTLDPESYRKLAAINDQSILKWITDMVKLARPSSVYVVTNSSEDIAYVAKVSLERGEELPTNIPRHTAHFDGPRDLARDRKNTRVLTQGGTPIPLVNTYDRDVGLREIREISRGIMEGREMFIAFYCFGPPDSDFTMYAVQLTDSAYVIHSENILYRNCYDEFVKKASNLRYAKFFHSAGVRDRDGWSVNVDRRRIFIDIEDSTVYSVNTQYAGNSVGLKKLMLRLCVYVGYREKWLCEHMFIAGVRGPGGRVTYFTGAFPAGCGKTSTVFSADTVVGDDIAIIKNVGGLARGVNPEVGMFGIIDGVNPADDPDIYEILTSPDTEVIFSNVLLKDGGEVWWRGKESALGSGLNYAGRWWPGMKDGSGLEIPPSHPNARFTTSIRYLKNLDPRIDHPLGVPIHGMIFGGRDPRTLPPVLEAFNWDHGVVTIGASLESEKTAAVLEKVGEMEFNPFAMLDFLSISPGKFLELHFEFGENLTVKPKVFSVNYFLKDEFGRYIANKVDKKAWLKWMELRVHGDVEAIETPVGYIPTYSDLARLFDEYLGKTYSEERYLKEFSIRVDQYLEKTRRIWSIYSEIPDTPRKLFEILTEQKRKLEDLRARYGSVVEPFKLERK